MASAEQLKAQLLLLKDESQRLSATLEMLSQTTQCSFARVMNEQDIQAVQTRITDSATRMNELSETTEDDMSDEKCFVARIREMQKVIAEKRFILDKLSTAIQDEFAVTEEDELLFEP